jgi:hypothetical protein
LEFKKPQLDELVNTAESLKTDANKLQLQSKGECPRELFIIYFIAFVDRGLNKISFSFWPFFPWSM